MAAQWEPGKEYAPGAIVKPRATPLTPILITDPGLELGGGSWTLDGGVTVSAASPHTGANSLACSTIGGPLYARAATVDCGAFHKATVWCMAKTGGASTANSVSVVVEWLNAALAVVRTDAFAPVSGTLYTESRFSIVGPKDAAKVRIGAVFNRSVAGTSYADDFRWALEASGFRDLLFKATQATAQTSSNVEPTWPTTVGATVADASITWTAVVTSRIAWKAVPVMSAGGSIEPTWPTVDGGTVVDGDIIWRAFTRQITDVNCPQTDIVTITASKVFVGDNDIVRYCATNAPLDWTATLDAGFLPFGLQTYGSNPVAALGVYRGNLVPFNSEAFQMWQADADPANMGKIDELPIGSVYHRALSPVSNDLFFLSGQGVRTVGIAGGSTNLEAGDVGMPIDPLIVAALAEAEVWGIKPLAIYYPNTGQYWLAIPSNAGNTQVFVYTMNKVGQVGAWSRYIFPFFISAFAQFDNKMLVRADEAIMELDDQLLVDFEAEEEETDIVGTLWWPWLDMGSAGVTKMLDSFDIVGNGAPTIEIGWDQTNLGTFTDPYELPADTLPGQRIPFPLSAPSFSIRLTYTGQWEFNALNIYLNDFGSGS